MLKRINSVEQETLPEAANFHAQPLLYGFSGLLPSAIDFRAKGAVSAFQIFDDPA